MILTEQDFETIRASTGSPTDNGLEEDAKRLIAATRTTRDLLLWARWLLGSETPAGEYTALGVGQVTTPDARSVVQRVLLQYSPARWFSIASNAERLDHVMLMAHHRDTPTPPGELRSTPPLFAVMQASIGADPYRAYAIRLATPHHWLNNYMPYEENTAWL